MSNPGPDIPEQYIVTFRRPGGGEYRRCLEGYGVVDLAESIRAEERVHGCRFTEAVLLE